MKKILFGIVIMFVTTTVIISINDITHTKEDYPYYDAPFINDGTPLKDIVLRP